MGDEVPLPTHFQRCVLGGSFKPCLHTWQKLHLTNLLCLICSELQPLPMKGQAMPWLLGSFPGDTFNPYLRQMLRCVLTRPTYPVSWWVNFLQMEVFWFSVQDWSLCACELLALGGVSLNFFHATGVGVDPKSDAFWDRSSEGYYGCRLFIYFCFLNPPSRVSDPKSKPSFFSGTTVQFVTKSSQTKHNNMPWTNSETRNTPLPCSSESLS